MIENLKDKIKELVESKFRYINVDDIVTDSVEKHKYSDIYYITVLDSSSEYRKVVKIIKPSSPLYQIQGEYNAYKDLSNILQDSPFTTLKVIGYTESPNALVSVLADGEPLSNLIYGKDKSGLSGLTGNERMNMLKESFGKAGELLAHYHRRTLSENEADNKLNPGISNMLIVGFEQ